MFDFKNPDYKPVFVSRYERLEKIRADAALLKIAKVHYAHNPVDFINDWMMTYDPRRDMPTMPFILWPKQVEYIGWLKERYDLKEDGLVEKSRDAGATYLNAAFSVWLWSFHAGSKVSFGSRKQDLVDKIGDTDTIFEKIRMILRLLPIEFLPNGYDENKHATFMKIVNIENGATITGEAGDNIGRGGRSGIYFKDESAFYERPDKIDAALSQNSDCKIDVSTPNGNGNPFYKKRHGGKIPVFIFDWRDDPRKTESWYEKQKDLLEPWILPQEVDRDYNASVENICIPAAYVKAAIDFPIKAMGAVVAGLDVADEGGDKNALIIREGTKITHIEGWAYGDTTQTSRKAVNICEEFFAVLINYDSIGVGAGVKGEMKSLKEVYTLTGRHFPKVVGVNVGSSELLDMYTEERSDKQMFVNLRASLWWRMRRRFERTWERANGVKDWPDDDCISIPNHQELVSELSQPLREINEAGKIRIESKEKMKKRGIKSPNYADALTLCFANSAMIPVSIHGRSTNIAARVDRYVKGKTKRNPWETDNTPSGNNYLGGLE